MTKQLKSKLEPRVRRQQNKNPCYIKTTNADGSVSVQGTKALGETANYTFQFTRQLLKAWQCSTGY